jgi:CBS-domain-containing membrane protein
MALERLRHEGATGATALRGIAGFGAGHRLRVAGVDALNATPIVLEWVDRAERVARILPTLDELLPDALITVEELQVYRAVLRSGGLFGDRTVGQVMARDVATAELSTPIGAAVELMLARAQPLLPILDERGSVAGVLSDGDLERRAGLALPLRLISVLSGAERQALLDALPPRPLAELMTGEPRTVYSESSIPQAISPLIEWGVEQLPVVDRAGRLAGLFGVEHALLAARRAPDMGDPANAVRDAEPPTPISLVMQRAVPVVAAAAPLADVMAQLLAAPGRFLVVVEEGRPVGTLTDAMLVERLSDPARAAWLAALRAPGAPPQPVLDLPAEHTAGRLADRAIATIAARDTQDAGIVALLDGGHERLVVVDEDGRLAGLLARRGLLRALAQASTE